MQTRRDFEMVADVLARADLGDEARYELAREFANRFQSNNPRFDRRRFYQACGVVRERISLEA